MTALHQTEVDGVRCFWVETGRPTLAAALMFRYGMADEPLTESGFLHLIEHLSLHGRGGGPLHVNGQVGLLETILDAHGPAELVANHMAGVTAWLSSPSYGELDRERNVLRAEAAVRGDGPSVRAMSWRYGARGPGVTTYSEPALGRATPELLTARAGTVFTRGNAALVLDGPPPANLKLELPDGPLLPIRPAVSVEKSFPAMYVDEAGLVLSGVVPRSAAMAIGCELLRKTLTDRLRHQDGAAYAPWASYERVDAEHAVLLGGTDVRPESLPTLADTTLELTRLLRRTPDLTQLAELKASHVQGLRDPYAQVGVAFRAANAVLHGREPQTLAKIVDELEEVGPHEVVVGFESFLDTLLVGLPGATAWRNQLRTLTAPTRRPSVKGKRFRSVNWPADRARLVVGEEAVEIRVADEARVARFAEAEGVLAHENGLRHVVAPDGYVISVNPHAWRRGAEAVIRLDRLAPPGKRLPMPAVDGIEQGMRLGVWRRWTGPLRGRVDRLHLLRAALFLGGLAVIAVGIAVAIVARNGVLGFLAGALGVGMIHGAVAEVD